MDVFSPTASIGGIGSTGDYDMWLANVCTRCRVIFCGACLELGGPTPCPKCGSGTLPAYKKIVAQMGGLLSYYEIRLFYGKTVAAAREAADSSGILKEKVKDITGISNPQRQIATRSAQSVEAATLKARESIPDGAFDLESPQVQEPRTGQVTIYSFTEKEEDVRRNWKSAGVSSPKAQTGDVQIRKVDDCWRANGGKWDVPSDAELIDLKCITPYKKGWFIVRPSQWLVDWRTPPTVGIAYWKPACVRVRLEPDRFAVR